MTQVPGPAYREMLHPELLSPTIRRMAAAARADEFDPANLFNITWRNPEGVTHHVVLPTALTGVDANIIVMTGACFPSGSHKVGPAYATLMEAELNGEIEPGANTILGPSTGNFGIGAAYVARLKGYDAVVIMPRGMSAERYHRIRKYGAGLDLTEGSESDVIRVLERTEELKKDPRNKVLAQFELFPNYRFHRFVTGRSALSLARKYGDGRIAAFVSAPGSAGTLAAGDEIKTSYSDCVVCAVEPEECSTLFNNGCGTHAIEGIGDNMVTLIHNILTTDFVQTVRDSDCLAGLDILQYRAEFVEERLELGAGSLQPLQGLFGISGLCNVLAAIRLARFLDLGPRDNVVTVATDGFDRYPSVLAKLPPLHDRFESVFRAFDRSKILDVRPPEQKERLFGYKEALWTRFNYTRAYLDRMKSQSFWEAEYAKIPAIDDALQRSQVAAAC